MVSRCDGSAFALSENVCDGLLISEWHHIIMERGSKEIPCFSTVVVESCLNHYRAIFEFVSPTVVLAILCLVCSYFDPIQGPIIIQTVHVCQTHKIWGQSVAGRRL